MFPNLLLVDVSNSFLIAGFFQTSIKAAIYHGFCCGGCFVWVLLLFCVFWCFCLFVLFFVFSRAALAAYIGSQARGRIGAVPAGLCHSHSNIRSESAIYTTAHGNTGLLTHWAGPGIKPATLWFLVGFVNHCAITGTPVMLFVLIGMCVCVDREIGK